ncbi:MAG: PDZ domain-containing protein [Spirochaetaceae bacterium]|nr:PDZ domain-containing protein [Spirochaetaceae bacterium]
MKSKIVLILLISTFLISPIFTQESETTPPKAPPILVKYGMVSQAYLGFGWFFSYDGTMKVTEIHQGANTTGKLKVGDVILKIQGQVIQSHEDAFRLIYSIFPGEVISVQYLREGEQGEVSYQTGAFGVTSYTDKLTRLCISGETVNLGIIVSFIENLTVSAESQGSVWKKSIARGLTSQEESYLVANLGIFKSFSLVDRFRIEAILEEQQFSLSEMVTDSVKIGELLGATHILDLSLARYPKDDNGFGYIDSITLRLLDIETGELIASVTREQI